MRVVLRRRRAVAAAAAFTVVVACLPVGYAAESVAATSPCPWVGSSAPIPDRVSQVLTRMSLADKLGLVHGVGMSLSYVGVTPGIAKLCIPMQAFEDGPAGVGDGLTDVTQLPAPVAAAATWDRSAVGAYEAVIAREQAAKGTTVTLSPTINIVRDPRWGRAFESFGEDPYLTGQLAVAAVRGIQAQGQQAQVKHLAVYNQETNRNTPADDALVSERAMQELYLPAFGEAVGEGAAASVMCSYSVINNTPACQNGYLQNTVLRQQFGFGGYVTSDWDATKSTVASVDNGLDVEMPSGVYLGNALQSAVQNGVVATRTVDTMVRRILTEMFAFGLFDKAPTGSPAATATSAASIATGLSVAKEGSVLLKNRSSVLPLSSATHSIAVIGDDAADRPQYAGGGSAGVTAAYGVAPLLGIQRRVPAGTTVAFDTGTSPESAAAAAAKADVAVVFASNFTTEGADISSINLPGNQDAVIAAVARANPRTIVVLNTGSAVAMPWLADAAGVVEAWYPGQDDGTAIAALLYGDVNPSGHLPVSFPRSLADVPAHTGAQFPGVNGQVSYSEGLAVGYRWYDQTKTTPLFPFGFGLSYTTFAFSNLTVSPMNAGGNATATATVTNTGSRAGAEVVQLYVGQPAAGEPPKALKGFSRVNLAAKASTQVSFTLSLRDLATWDATAHAFATVPGSYSVLLGDSAVNLPLRSSLAVTSGHATRSVRVSNPGPQDYPYGSSVSLPITGTDSAGATVSFSATGLPRGLSISSSGVITGNPTAPGTTTVTVTGTDAAGARASTSFTFTVNPAGGAGGPTGSITGLAGLCLDLAQASNVDGTAVQTWACNGTNAQTWTVRADGTLRALGKCLDVRGAGVTDATAVDLFTCNGTGAQQWQRQPDGSLRSPMSGKCLDVPSANTAPGTHLQIWDCNGTAAQRWVLPS